MQLLDIFNLCQNPQARSALQKIQLNLDDGKIAAMQYLGDASDCVFAIANAIAIHPCDQNSAKTFGKAFRGLVSDQRFESLLQAPSDIALLDLPWWIRFAKQKQIALDYANLFQALERWDEEGGETIKRQWSMDFWWRP